MSSELKVIRCSKDGRRLFKAYCRTCLSDRGYKRKSELNLECQKCASANNSTAHMNTPNVRNKATKSKITNKYSNVDIEDKVKHKTTYKYKMVCVKCSKDKGYCYLSSANKPCRECYILSVKKENKQVRDKLKSNMRSNLYHRLKRRGLNKTESTFKSLSYTPEQLKEHLEKQFYADPRTGQEMTWDNYGEWHIDHVTPDSWFNYTTTECEDFKKCWSLENLQPMWAKENIKKSNRFSSFPLS